MRIVNYRSIRTTDIKIGTIHQYQVPAINQVTRLWKYRTVEEQNKDNKKTYGFQGGGEGKFFMEIRLMFNKVWIEKRI